MENNNLPTQTSSGAIDRGDNISVSFQQHDVEDLREKLRLLIDAISLVSKLASVDSIDYQHYRFNDPEKLVEIPLEGRGLDWENETPRLGNNSRILVTTKMVSHDRLPISQTSPQVFKNEKRDDSEDPHDLINIQHQLDNLQTQGDLKDTSLSTLIKSIHRLQSNVTHLQAETESNAALIHNLQDSLTRSNNRIQQLENATQALYHEKTELKAQLRFKKKECRYFAKTVREYVTLKRKEELEKDELYAATRVSVHESMLKSCQSKKRGDTLDTDADHLSVAGSLEDFDTLRKLDSGDMSNYDLFLEDASFTGQSFELARISSGESPESLRRYMSYSSRSFYQTEPRDRATSTDSLASTQSRVTETCVPTVRFDFQLEDKTGDPETPSGTQTYVYELKNGSHLGLVFKFMEMTPPRQPLLDGKLLDAIDGKEASSSDPIVKNSPMRGQGITSKFDDFFSRNQNHHSKKKDTATVSDELDCAVVVGGFDNFDDTSNTKPSLGARLIAIGDEPLIHKKNQTLEMIHDMIIEASYGDSTAHRKVKLTFRNDPLTRDQKNKLLEITPRVDNMHVKDKAPLLENDKPKFFDKIFSNMSRDQRREKVTQPAPTEVPPESAPSGSDMLKRDFFKIKL